MKTNIKDLEGNHVTVTDLDKAIEQCRDCIDSPCKMPSGHTVGENYAYMLEQLLELRAKDTASE
ncbi:MAG: NADH-quinone oxidoreductase subunit F [Alistipes senegalensis]|nr:NADH-quinone oxidoreductase subunit F [Bacteroides cellulosilyticus]MCM1352951.1 NADH-quinone oxidoreductase subunit F [Alistipes senegalensis]